MLPPKLKRKKKQKPSSVRSRALPLERLASAPQ
jgi:hypothetical protein